MLQAQLSHLLPHLCPAASSWEEQIPPRGARGCMAPLGTQNSCSSNAGAAGEDQKALPTISLSHTREKWLGYTQEGRQGLARPLSGWGFSFGDDAANFPPPEAETQPQSSAWLRRGVCGLPCPPRPSLGTPHDVLCGRGITGGWRLSRGRPRGRSEVANPTALQANSPG